VTVISRTVEAEELLPKVTILAGAFTVGVGFGLQTVINNFVCGLILLFERPIKVGDFIQIDTDIGEVRRIGVRACVIRTDGSEVIVPNGTMISNKVTNRTLSDWYRAIEVSITVARGVAPQHVIEVLKRVAANHCSGSLPDPAATSGRRKSIVGLRQSPNVNLEARWSRLSPCLTSISWQRRRGTPLRTSVLAAQRRRRFAVCSGFEIARPVEIGNQPGLLRLPPQQVPEFADSRSGSRSLRKARTSQSGRLRNPHTGFSIEQRLAFTLDGSSRYHLHDRDFTQADRQVRST
jgi:hypothetical protein